MHLIHFELIFKKFIYLFIWLSQVLVAAREIFVAMCGIFVVAYGIFSCGMQASSSCSKRGLLFVVVRRLLIAVASLVVEHGL